MPSLASRPHSSPFEGPGLDTGCRALLRYASKANELPFLRSDTTLALFINPCQCPTYVDPPLRKRPFRKKRFCETNLTLGKIGKMRLEARDIASAPPSPVRPTPPAASISKDEALGRGRIPFWVAWANLFARAGRSHGQAGACPCHPRRFSPPFLGCIPAPPLIPIRSRTGSRTGCDIPGSGRTTPCGPRSR